MTMWEAETAAMRAEIERLRDDSKMLALCEGDRKEMATEIERLQAECSEFKRHLIGRRGEIERLRAITAHAAGFLAGMAARIKHCAGDGESLIQAAEDCRAMARSLQQTERERERGSGG